MQKLHYKGNCTDFIIGQVVGPDVGNGFLAAKTAIYNHLEDRTTVYFVPLGPRDFERCLIDNWGFLRFPDYIGYGPGAIGDE